jgi:hypothetical protein
MVNSDLIHIMELEELNIKAQGQNKEEAHKNLHLNIDAAINELEAMKRSDIGNILLQGITVNPSRMPDKFSLRVEDLVIYHDRK